MEDKNLKPKGCYFNPYVQRWQVKCTVEGKRVSLGYYENVYEAMAVYEEAKRTESERKRARKQDGNTL